MKRQSRASRRTALLLSSQPSAAAPGERVITHAEAKSWSPDARPAKEYAQSRAGEVAFSVFDMRGRQREFKRLQQRSHGQHLSRSC